MTPTIEKHIHQYVRKKEKDSKGRTYFRCFDKLCYHTALRSDLIGKACICSFCGMEFILTAEALRRAKPRCLACTNSDQGRLQKRVQELAQTLMVVAKDTDEQKRQEILNQVFGGSTEISDELPTRNRAAEISQEPEDDFEELDEFIEGEENNDQ